MRLPNQYDFKRNEDRIKKIAIFIVLGSFLFAIFGQRHLNNTLDQYVGQEEVEEGSVVTEPEKEISTQTYENEKAGFKVEIPEEWKKIESEDNIMFLHEPSNSSVTFTVSDYNPEVNNATSDSMSALIAEEQKTFVSFNKTSGSNYQVVYQDKGETTYDYIQDVNWNKEKQVEILCVCNDLNYSKIVPYYEKIISGFKWTDKEKIIPEGYGIIYLNTVLAQIGVPDTWSIGQVDGAVSASNEDNTQNLTFTVMDPVGKPDMVNASDLSSLVASGKSGFIMADFTKDEKGCYANYSYNVDNQRVLGRQCLFFSDKAWYSLNMEGYESVYDEKIVDQCVGLFMTFPEAASETTTAPSSAAEPSTVPAQEESTEETQAPVIPQETTTETEEVPYSEETTEVQTQP